MEAFPKNISRKEKQTLSILWQDGHRCEYSFVALREACTCANCVNEWTQEKMITQIDPQIDIKEIRLVGNYAIQIIWSDGHNTGIYPFERLRAWK